MAEYFRMTDSFFSLYLLPHLAHIIHFLYPETLKLNSLWVRRRFGRKERVELGILYWQYKWKRTSYFIFLRNGGKNRRGHSKEHARLNQESWVSTPDQLCLLASFSLFLEIRRSTQSVVLKLFCGRILIEMSWSHAEERQSKLTLSSILQEQLFFFVLLEKQ